MVESGASHRRSPLRKHLLKLGHIVVMIAKHGAVRESTAIIDAGMVLSVTGDIVISTDDGAEDSEV